MKKLTNEEIWQATVYQNSDKKWIRKEKYTDDDIHWAFVFIKSLVMKIGELERRLNE